MKPSFSARLFMLPAILLVITIGCAPAATQVPTVVPTDTPAPTLAPTNTPTLVPTAKKAPTATRTATPTFEPAPQLSSEVINSTLRAAGYKRQPFYTSKGEDAFFWDNGSGIDFYTYPDGIEMIMLNDPNNPSGRLSMIDKGIDTITPLFAPGAIAALTKEAHGYAERVVAVSGDPTILDYGQEPWLGKLMEFNGYGTSIRNGGDDLYVYFRLLYREYKCDMSRYLYCYYVEMPSMTFTGGDTLTSLNIWIGYK